METIRAPEWGQITKTKRFDAKILSMRRSIERKKILNGLLGIVVFMYALYTLHNLVEYFFG